MDRETIDLMRGYLSRAEEKLKSAKDLFEAEDWSDCVSRAYYCAFHSVQALFLSEGMQASSHQGAVNLFGMYFVKSGKFDKRFVKILKNLKDDRESGDYEVFSAIDEEVARKAANETGEFLNEAKRYLEKYLKKKGR